MFVGYVCKDTIKREQYKEKKHFFHLLSNGSIFGEAKVKIK